MNEAAAPLPRTFYYSKASFGGLISVLLFPLWPFLIALWWSLSDGYPHDVPKLVSSLITPFFPCVLLWRGLLGWGAFRSSPIDVSARGSDCGWFARPSKTIYWSSRPRITKETGNSDGWYETIEVDEGQQKISITPNLKDYDDFKELLNARAEVHGLPMTTIDFTGWKRIVRDGPSARL
jgi:hypothetical protein